jgi:hypothetical protein
LGRGAGTGGYLLALRDGINGATVADLVMLALGSPMPMPARLAKRGGES